MSKRNFAYVNPSCQFGTTRMLSHAGGANSLTIGKMSGSGIRAGKRARRKTKKSRVQLAHSAMSSLPLCEYQTGLAWAKPPYPSMNAEEWGNTRWRPWCRTSVLAIPLAARPYHVDLGALTPNQWARTGRAWPPCSFNSRGRGSPIVGHDVGVEGRLR